MSLTDHIQARIARNGPLTVAEFMADALMHPTMGYYATRDPLGARGDFITAPEISQMFGEMLGLCLAQAWLDQGAPPDFALVELGPGRGTLMADMLRAASKVQGFAQAAQVHLVEASLVLRAAQSQLLGRVTHHDTVESLPQLPTFLVANEFFDALPIRQFERDGAAWRERHIALIDGALSFGLGAATPFAHLAHRLEDTADGDVIEHCPMAAPIIESISQRIETHGGAALIIDYGDWRSLGDTLQALKGHRAVAPLDHIGHADLTAHVDFETLASAAKCAHTRLTPQGVYLERLGITARAQTLAQSLEADALDAHISAHRRLTHPSEMGTLFKVLGLLPANAPPLAGLTT
ncbi:class I SAM-dependent methyltransferase [Nereida sp. MMG025]|uniref:class I SAM-dependent methyltransferase n=1 Tax=Nereida sp. MMG025 TaxID=2909981 RepID=UPI001F30C115|nr:SAM-dependent methyltransferase [Nereida sp. MMG025]MCF6444080.1 SAM-dependent methyltransferase [Nereida sp. MMG025]